jgi:hypothetical protein
MLSSGIFVNLNNLKRLDFNSNVCAATSVGCDTCLLSMTELNSSLNTCFSNCQNNAKCAAKSTDNDNHNNPDPMVFEKFQAKVNLKLESLENLLDNLVKENNRS